MRLSEITDPIAKVPDVSGTRSRAWLCDLAEGRRSKGFAAEDDATLAHWVVEAPWAHPLWHSYSLVLVHLRDMPDNRPTKIWKPGATHEIWVWSIDPDKDRREMIETGIVEGHWLRPMNYGGQFIAEGDDVARAAVLRAVTLVCAGSLSPDTDFRWQWVELFGNDMVK